MFDPDLQVAWDSWRKTAAPVAEFRHGQHPTPASGFERFLNDVAVATFRLCDGLLRDAPGTYASTAGEFMARLEFLTSGLPVLAVPDSKKDEYRAYADLTYNLLSEIERVASRGEAR